jgi:hypothetical protein
LASYLAGLRITKRNISATILADVKRFFHQINTDEVFGTHNEADSRRQSTQCLPAELQEIERLALEQIELMAKNQDLCLTPRAGPQ